MKWGLHYLEGAVAGKTFGPGPTDHDSRIEIVNGNPMDLLPAPMVTKAERRRPEALGERRQELSRPGYLRAVRL